VDNCNAVVPGPTQSGLNRGADSILRRPSWRWRRLLAGWSQSESPIPGWDFSIPQIPISCGSPSAGFAAHMEYRSGAWQRSPKNFITPSHSFSSARIPAIFGRGHRDNRAGNGVPPCGRSRAACPRDNQPIARSQQPALQCGT